MRTREKAYSHCLFRTKDRPRIAQLSLRDFGYLLPNPTLERVGYSRISPPGDVSRKHHRLQQHTAGKCPNSRPRSAIYHPQYLSTTIAFPPWLSAQC